MGRDERWAPDLRRADIKPRGEAVDPRRVRLQLRIVEALMRVARPADRPAMELRATEILEKVALEIEPRADPELAAMLARARAEVASRRS